jgi:hypothetical protein
MTNKKDIQAHIDNDTNGTCAHCGDKLSADIGNLQPTWSDEFDNVVCWWCKWNETEKKWGN